MNIPEGLKGKKQVLILAGLVAALAVVFYFNFLLKPLFLWAVNSTARMVKIQSDLKGATSDIARIPKLQADMESYKEKVDRYEKKLPAEQEIPSLLESLSEMAKSSNIKIVGIMPVTGKEDRSERNQIYKAIPILINAKSGYHELGRFLNNLENSDRFMKVSDIHIRANPAAPKKHDVDLLVLTYILFKGR